MAYTVIVFLAALNCAALYIVSFFATGGHGSSEGVYQVRIFGFLWLAVFTAGSFALCARRKGGAAMGLAASALPAGYVAALLGMSILSTVGLLRPNSAEFELACKSAGPRFFAKPAEPVRSIAYDWDSDAYPPSINFFRVDSRGNVSERNGGRPQFPSVIRFTEGRCCQFEGPPLNGVRPYIRHPNGGAYFGVTELTADVVVTYRRTESAVKGTFEVVDVTVTDRRDKRELANLRYVLDQHRQRGCGATVAGTMDEKAFVMKAVGVE